MVSYKNKRKNPARIWRLAFCSESTTGLRYSMDWWARIQNLQTCAPSCWGGRSIQWQQTSIQSCEEDKDDTGGDLEDDCLVLCIWLIYYSTVFSIGYKCQTRQGAWKTQSPVKCLESPNYNQCRFKKIPTIRIGPGEFLLTCLLDLFRWLGAGTTCHL